MRNLTIRAAKIEDTKGGSKLYLHGNQVIEIKDGEVILQEEVDLTPEIRLLITEYLETELEELEFHGDQGGTLDYEIHDFLKENGLKTDLRESYKVDFWEHFQAEKADDVGNLYYFLDGYWALDDRSWTFNNEFHWYLRKLDENDIYEYQKDEDDEDEDEDEEE